MGSIWCSFLMWIVFSYITSHYQFKRFASAKTNNNFGIGAHISLKLRVSETHLMSFISVSVLAKKLEAYIWLHCDMVTQTIYSKKIFHYLSQKKVILYLSYWAKKMALFPPCLHLKDEELNLLLACCCRNYAPS